MKDSYNGQTITLCYGKSGLNYTDYSWLAGWNGYELRAVHKEQFATASHDHDSTYAAIDHNHDSSYASASHTHSSNSLTDIALTWSGEVTTNTDYFLAHDKSVTDRVLYRAINPTNLRTVIDASPTNHTHNYMPFTQTDKQITNNISDCSLYYCGGNTVPLGTDGFVLTGTYNNSWATQLFQHWINGATYVRSKNSSTTWGNWYRLLQKDYNDPIKMTSTSSNPPHNDAARFYYFVSGTTTKASIDTGF